MAKKDKTAEEPNPTGRPPLFASPEEMIPVIEDYFATCDNSGDPYTIPGLAYHLGFEDRHSVSEYAAKPLFTATIKKARLKIESQRVNQLLTSPNVAGKIFDLKNNFDYRDQREITGKDGEPLHPPAEQPVTAEQASALITQLHEKPKKKT